MLTAGLLIVAMDMPFDILGPANGWWSWSATDPNVAYRWYGVPVTSYYWHFAWGGILAGLTRAFGRYVEDPRRVVRAPLLALPVALLTMVLGVISFLPFHFLKARGVADGTIVAGALAASAVAAFSWSRGPASGWHAAFASRRAPADEPQATGLMVIPVLFYACHLLAALARFAAGPAAFAGQMGVIACVTTLALVLHRFAHRGSAAEPAPSRLQALQ
jgi:hypothetical protein